MSQKSNAVVPWITMITMLALLTVGPMACMVLANLTTHGNPFVMMVAFCVPPVGMALGLLAWQGLWIIRVIFGWLRILLSRGSRSAEEEFGGKDVPPGMIFLLIFPIVVGIVGGALIALLSQQQLLVSVALYGGLSLIYGLIAYGLSRAGIIFGADWWTLQY